MKITEYLKSFDINIEYLKIDESVYYKHLMNHKNFLFLLKKENYKCRFSCSECPLCYDISCLSCVIAENLNKKNKKQIYTDVNDKDYYKIKKNLTDFLIDFLIRKATPIQEELDI
jgi:hypothetical protein